MVGELIKEYLVGLGVKIDKPGFKEMESTINQTSSTISSATNGWAKDFVTASSIIATALASVTASVVGLMTTVAKQDLAMEKYARQMLVSKDAAMEMKQAVDALGESVQDIQLTPELYNRYKALVADGRSMKVGGDYEGTMKNFRDLIFEFTRMKQEASYAMQWVGYYLMKYLSRPLEDAKKSFRNLNDSLIKNMPVWTEKIARALVYIINVGRHFWDLLKSIGKTIYDVWDAFPRGIKIATAALAAFFVVLRASPLGRMIALVSSLLLLADDYFGYMEGKQAAMGPVWDKLNGYIDTGKQKFTEWGKALAPVWDKFVEYLVLAKDGAVELSGKISEWIEEVSQYKEMQDFVDTLKELGSSVFDLCGAISEFTGVVFKEFVKSLQKHDVVKRFIESLTALCKELNTIIKVISEVFKWLSKSQIVKDLIDAFGDLIGVLIDLLPLILNFLLIGKIFKFIKILRVAIKYLGGMFKNLGGVGRAIMKIFKSIKDGKGFEGFWKNMGGIIKELKGIVVDCLGSVGKLGLALLALASGDWSKARRLAKEALGFGESKAEAGGRFDFNGDEPTGQLSSLGESGSLEGDPAAFGTDSTGGPSFGAYQIAQRTMPSFLSYLDGYNPEYANRLRAIGSIDGGAFLDEWRKIANENPEGFKKLQHDFVRDNLYNKAINSISSRTGMDVSSRSKTLQEVVWSLAVQHGAGSGRIGEQDDGAARIFERAFEKLGDSADDEDYIKLLYELRKEYFSQSTPDERQAVWNRYDNIEMPAALDMLRAEREYEERKKKEQITNVESQFLNKDGEVPQYEFRNPPADMHEPTIIDIVREWWNSWHILPTSFDKDNVFANCDPIMLNRLMGGAAAAYSQSYGGTNIKNINYQIKVGDVIVGKTDASPQEIGQAVANETLIRLQSDVEQVASNRIFSGVTWT